MSNERKNGASRQSGLVVLLLLVLAGSTFFAAHHLMSHRNVSVEEQLHIEPTSEQPSSEPAVTSAPRIGLARPTTPLATGIALQGANLHRQFHDYVVGRMVGLDFTRREPQRFDDWVAYDDFEATEASDEGLLTQWDPGWYITHEWSWYGQRILQLIPGDIVCVNGEDILVEGGFDYPKDSYSSEVNEVVDPSYVVFQTCEPNSELNRIIYATRLEPEE